MTLSKGFILFFLGDGGNTSIWNQLSKTGILEALLRFRKHYLKYVLTYVKMLQVHWILW